ncbi:MAG TPA: lysine--tRNA ligase [Candidatus Saccharimonadales bacterium]|nr:lysine--tRNA ligase [Candidatus Saccharimonadales bacterium]
MQWLNQIVDELEARHPEGEILIESGSAPSGTYHLGHLREFLTPDAVYVELKRRGRQARHIHFVDDLDALRKVPFNVPKEYEKYLGMPLCDIPAPDGSDRSYADYFLEDVQKVCDILGIEVTFERSYKKYRSGVFVPAIELVMSNLEKVRGAITTASNRQLDADWVPIQILVEGRFKNRKFLGMDTGAKVIRYQNPDGSEGEARYDIGEVKLDWRLDWPARWWMLGVDCEPFGRDHSSAGSSYDTGAQLMKDVFNAPAPMPVPYDFINMAGDTKKMSASKGTGLSALESAQIMPAEVMRYFVLRAPANKLLHFDPIDGLVKLMDEFAALAAKEDRTEPEEQLLYVCALGIERKTVSRVPFSHLVASYQASLKDASKTLEVIKRTEHRQTAEEDADIIRGELKFIDAWLEKRAPEDVKFALSESVDIAAFTEQEKAFLKALGDKVAAAPAGADGAWFHNAIYEFKEPTGLSPKDMFTTLYRALIGKASGPRAGWFLSILPRDWLIARLHLEQ